MPIIKSAKKRAKTTKKAAVRNAKSKRSLKGAVKAFHSAVTKGDKKKVAASHSKAQSEVGKAAKKKVMHKNKAARKQSQLAKAAKKAAGVTKAAPAKKATAKKATPAKKAAPTKKAAAKKPATKKASAKKPVAKRK